MSHYWVVLAAAGSGKRMASAIPKQYLPLLDKPVITHALDKLFGLNIVAGGVVVLDQYDQHWPKLTYQTAKPLWQTPGGAERCQSVYQGLLKLSTHAQADDWVLVHDAARPCVRIEDIEHLIQQLADDPVGGLLAVPVKDTLKSADRKQRISHTLDRSQIWQAQTPQLFRFQLLQMALATALDKQQFPTDEAAAIEQLGYHPRLVMGHYDNVKITTQEDILLAEYYLRQQNDGC